jgi:hypothetical protein
MQYPTVLEPVQPPVSIIIFFLYHRELVHFMPRLWICEDLPLDSFICLQYVVLQIWDNANSVSNNTKKNCITLFLQALDLLTDEMLVWLASMRPDTRCALWMYGDLRDRATWMLAGPQGMNWANLRSRIRCKDLWTCVGSTSPCAEENGIREPLHSV